MDVSTLVGDYFLGTIRSVANKNAVKQREASDVWTEEPSLKCRRSELNIPWEWNLIDQPNSNVLWAGNADTASYDSLLGRKRKTRSKNAGLLFLGPRNSLR